MAPLGLIVSPAVSEVHRAPRRVLPVIVLAQLLGTAPWFAVNAVMPDLQRAHGWAPEAVGSLTSALQLGFIAGTLVFALLALADRVSARLVFLACALAAAGCTVAAAAAAPSFSTVLMWRVLTGFFLAGIYPVGMKLAAQWFPRGLGNALGWLVGALVLGSASPHALRALGVGWDWTAVFHGVALMCAAGGVAVMALVPEPHHLGAPAPGLRLAALARAWADRRLRASVLGYFGHMWELYTMWVLLPLVLALRLDDGNAVSWAAFLVMGAGALGCIGGGLVARRFGSARVAGVQLAASGLCCLLAPWAVAAPMQGFMLWLLVWGISVAGDSPQFSALTASNAPAGAVGSVLTLVNCIGFAISVLSIELFVGLVGTQPLPALLPWLAIGPLVGLWALRPLLR
ncbi:MAG: MFS transporter [Rubrivivax sp.]|nr:MFS transporter [Rubrivivax sp.]